MSYTRKAVYGAGLIFLMSILAAAVAYGIRIFLARKLGPAEYGLFSSVFAVVIIFLFVRDLGFPQAIVKYVAEFAAQQKYSHLTSLLGSALIFEMIGSLLLAIPFFLLSDWLALAYFKDSRAAEMLQLFILYLFGSVLFTIPKDTLLGFKKITLFSLGDLLKNILVLGSMIWLFSLGYGIFSPVWAYVLVCPLLFIWYSAWLWRTFPFLKYKAAEFSIVAKQLFTFAVPVFATAAGGKVIGYIDTLILTYFRSSVEVGIYNAVLPTALLFIYIGTAVSAVVFPLSAELSAQKNFTKLKEGVRLLHSYLLLAATPLIGLALVFAPFFMRILFGEEYISGSGAFQILILGVLLYLTATVNHTLLSALGKPWLVTMTILSSAAINVILNFLFIPRLGIWGAAIATSVSYLFALVWSTILITRELSLPAPWQRWGKVLAAGAIYSGVIYFIAQNISLNSGLEMFISAGTALIIYGLIIYKWKLIDGTELKYYWKILRKKQTL